MSRRRELSDEERDLWSGLTRSVTPLRRPGRMAARSEGSGKPIAEKAHAPPPGRLDRLRALVPKPQEPQESPKPVKPPALVPLGRRLKQRVARGRDPIDARIDLHGHTQKQAHAALLRFLQRAQADGSRMVLVVTGKGGPRRGERDPGSERGVLRRQVPMWLSLPEFRSFIVGFEDAHVGHGGEGALYIRLRRLQATDC
jgi:DNA-nicking Smr family endonuclease